MKKGAKKHANSLKNSAFPSVYKIAVTMRLLVTNNLNMFYWHPYKTFHHYACAATHCGFDCGPLAID
ncbi:MAG: hypothetical protein ACI9LY_000211 [Arenicella sp.]|jgi:hypothetical protein